MPTDLDPQKHIQYVYIYSARRCLIGGRRLPGYWCARTGGVSRGNMAATGMATMFFRSPPLEICPRYNALWINLLGGLDSWTCSGSLWSAGGSWSIGDQPTLFDPSCSRRGMSGENNTISANLICPWPGGGRYNALMRGGQGGVFQNSAVDRLPSFRLGAACQVPGRWRLVSLPGVGRRPSGHLLL